MKDTLIVATENFSLSELEFLSRLLVAIGIGFVLGLEREFSGFSIKEELFAGVRTFILISLVGFIAALLSFIFSPYVFIACFAGVFVMVTTSYWISAKKGSLGGTSEFATILAFLLGALTLLGYIEIVLAITVVATVVLSMKFQLKNIVGQITKEEFSAFVQFVVIALLILPFLPNAKMGPFEVLNPREIGWVVVLTSGIGFIGYILMKFLGTDRGILLTGIVGGLVSSTVVTWTFTKKSKETPALSRNYTVAIMAAAAIMIIRVLIWVFIFNKNLLPKLLFPIGLLFVAAIGVTLYFQKSGKTSEKFKEKLPLGEPLNIKDALFFGFLYTGILLLVSYASSEYGHKGIYISSAISALTDIDAITISVSKLAGDTINVLSAQNAILLATLSNTIVKIGIAVWGGSKQLRKHVLFGYGLVFIAGLIGFLILNLI